MIEEDEETKEVYEIKIADGYEEDAYRIKEDHLLDGAYEEEQLEEVTDDYGIIEHEEENVDKSVDKNYSKEYESYEAEIENDDQFEMVEESVEQPIPPAPSEIEKTMQDKSSYDTPSSPSKNIVDPDERYLMSCLPAFKRFTPQQKAYVRMGIEKLFYEVEFENVSEPMNKRSRIS